MLIFLFGEPGVGKNYIGNILTTYFGYYFWDADLALPENMQAAIKNKQIFTQDMRDQFTEIIIKNIKILKLQYPNLVIAQALYKEKNRKQIATTFPEIKFILIKADNEKVINRLKKRNNAVDQGYAEKIQRQFEKPLLPHNIIINNTNQDDVIKQVQAIFS